MHPPLDRMMREHPECKPFIEAYIRCNNESNMVSKVMNKCNETSAAMERCIFKAFQARDRQILKQQRRKQEGKLMRRMEESPPAKTNHLTRAEKQKLSEAES